MNEKTIIQEAMSFVGWSQETLAEKVGLKNQSGVAHRLRGKSMRVDTFFKFLDAMGFSIQVQSSDGKVKWDLVSDENEKGETVEEAAANA
jgi:ribosome-binding protein aMBF1 (putative translation factor)